MPFYRLDPPYHELLHCVPRNWRPPLGSILVWALASPVRGRELDMAAQRPPGVPLVIVLLPGGRVSRSPLLEVIHLSRPHSVVPSRAQPSPSEIISLFRRELLDLPDELLDFLVWRGWQLDHVVRQVLGQMIELSSSVSSLSQMCRHIYVSRRALGRRFADRDPPPPSHWLQLFRVLRACAKLQGSDLAIADAAISVGYPDPFTFSNQLFRLTGMRPSHVRQLLGWEWLVEAWLIVERAAGRVRLAAPSSKRNGSPERPPRAITRGRNLALLQISPEAN